MLMAPIYVSKMIEIHYQEKHLVTSLIFSLIFSKKKKRFIVISNIKLTSFQINLMLEFFMCLRLELLKLL